MALRRHWLVAMLALVGCDLDLSTSATTITATGQTNGVTSVVICAGPSQGLGCNDQESFDVTFGSDEESATEGLLSFGSLEADFSSVAAAPLTVTRASDGATASVVSEPFDLTGPASTDVIQRGATIELAWTPSGGDRASWTGNVLCGETDYTPDQPFDIDDTGTATIHTDDLPQGPAGTCTATVGISRSHDGTLDSAFPASSTFVAEQDRVISFQLAE